MKEAEEFSNEVGFVMNFIDLKRSKGNFYKDADNNTILDLSMGGNSMPLGYNHDEFINKRRLSTYDIYLNNSINVSEFPSTNFNDLLRETMYLNNPDGVTEVHFSPTPHLAIEQAISSAFLQQEPNLTDASSTDFSNLPFRGSVLCFEHSNHSKTFAGQSLNPSLGSIGLPKLDWATCKLPRLKFPLVNNERENSEEEDRCIAGFKKTIKDRENTINPVKAVIIEPITFMGTHFATPTFYQKLRDICAKRHIPFIIDET